MIKDSSAREWPRFHPLHPSFLRLNAIVIFGLSALAGCGGGGGSDGGNGVTYLDDTGWVAGEFKPASDFADRCAVPRTGIDPSTNSAYPDRLGTGLDERNFIRSWSNETYLWYDEIVDRNPFDHNDKLEYFDLLKTDAKTASGKPKDQFHFHMPTSEYRSLSQSGTSVGYGVVWSIIENSPPREVLVTYVEPGSPAASANLSRGQRVVEVDGHDLINGSGADVFNAGLWPSESGESHTLRIRELDGAERDVTLIAENAESTPVLEVARVGANNEVGYILFNDHIGTAEAGLKQAVEQLQAGGGVADLVLDVRYNGGGYLAIASQLAYMIAGPGQINGRVFETMTFNDKRSAENDPFPFLDEAVGFSVTKGQPLPNLGLDRVFVLTGPDTCSASESIINALRGVDVEVIQIGSTTCGKPYGFYPEDNCGTTYFTIQFQNENAKGFSDYADGFSPQNAVSNPGEPLPGCEVGDDFTHQLGDPAEARLAAALHYRANPDNPCSLAASSAQQKMGASLAAPSSLSAVNGRVIKSPALQGRVVERRE
ncbi:peptidase [Proteobacteria bacterium 005FR1]|nr:peptidase [Proteobacteria bacterium 005FR1]